MCLYSSCSCSLHVDQPMRQSRTLFEESTTTGSNQCSCTKGFFYQYVYAEIVWKSLIFSHKWLKHHAPYRCRCSLTYHQCSVSVALRNWTVWHTMRKPYLLNRETLLLEESYSGGAYIARGLYACTSSELMFLHLCTVWIECDHITQTSDCMEYLLALYSQSTLHGVLCLWQFGRQLYTHDILLSLKMCAFNLIESHCLVGVL